MKALPLVALVAVTCANAALAQTAGDTDTSSHIVEIGTRSVRVPPPDGFTRIGRRYKHILAVQEAAEPAENEIVALHLPTDQLSKYGSDRLKQPEFFTKVSIARRGRDTEITPANFVAVGSYLEKEFGKLTDPRGRSAVAEQHYVSKNLTELFKFTTRVKWDQPINLGVFEKSGRVHSTLVLMSLSANNTNYKFLGSVSVVHVSGRLIFVYVYKANPADADLQHIRDLTRKWTASIVVSNEELTASRN